MSQTLRFNPGGTSTASTPKRSISVRSGGSKSSGPRTSASVRRSQQWNVRCAATGKLLHSDPSREACLAWERANLGPPNPDVAETRQHTTQPQPGHQPT